MYAYGKGQRLSFLQEMTFNTGETPEELRAAYNPEGSVLRKVQERLLEMLLYLDEVCKTIDVPYRLDGGNILGAIRHQGFIPWDDDMDVVVEYKYYDKLCNYLATHPHPQFAFQSPETDKGYFRFWNTLRDTKSEYIHKKKNALNDAFEYRGLQVDIFCYHPRMIPFLHRIASLFYQYTVMKGINHSFAFAKSMFWFQRRIINPVFYFISRHFGNKNLYMHNYGVTFPYRYPKEALLPHSELEFEGHVFPGPADPAAFCRIQYGHFMDLPPKDKRKHHDVDYVFY